MANCAPASVTAFSCSALVVAPTIASSAFGVALDGQRLVYSATSERVHPQPARSHHRVIQLFATITGTTGPLVKLLLQLFPVFIRFSRQITNQIVLKVMQVAPARLGELLAQRAEHRGRFRPQAVLRSRIYGWRAVQLSNRGQFAGLLTRIMPSRTSLAARHRRPRSMMDWTVRPGLRRKVGHR